MKIIKQDAIRFVERFHELYLTKQYDEISDMFCDSVHIGGISVDEVIEGKNKIIDFLRLISEVDVDDSNTEIIDVYAKEISDRCWSVQSVFRLNTMQNTHSIQACFATKCSLIAIDGKLQINDLLFTLINEEKVKESNHQLKDFIMQKEEAFQNNEDLLNSVPGGIFKCLYDEKLTLIEMSDGFLRMCGYTREDMENKFQNSLRAIIHEEDMERLDEEVKHQLKLSNNKQIEYRIRHKNGNNIWVLDKGTLIKSETGLDCFHCIVIDVTQEKNIREQYRYMLERNQIIMNQTNDVVFEWDIKKDQLFVSTNWDKNFGKQRWPDGSSLIEILNDESYSPFFKNDLPVLLEVLQKIRSGESYVEVECRILDKYDNYIWCKIRVSVQLDQNGESDKAIGVVINIDQEKRKSLLLLKKANQDALTGISNKASTKELIIAELLGNTQEMGALLIIDIDDFKCVNDTRGHLFGDSVLSDIATILKANCRSTDILGRIGGDEFLLFLKDVSLLNIVKEKAQKIIDSIRDLKSLAGLPKQVSSSIGISLYPKHGKDYNTLYKYADFALYQAKIEGKNQYSIYDEKNMNEYLKKERNVYASAIHSTIDSNEEELSIAEIVPYLFGILYESENIQRAIQDIIKIVGEKFDVSRVYIFEDYENGRYCKNTFEWCNKGITPVKDTMQQISYAEDLGGCYLENFNENGVFYCADINTLPKQQRNILSAQGVKSLLQCSIRDNGKFRGFIGFDECGENRFWTKDQIFLLQLIAEILTIFLLKSRKEEMIELENKGLLQVLDNQDAFIYIVEEGTFELLYANKKTKVTSNSKCQGEYCYRLFMGRDKPCELCAARNATRTQPSDSIEFFNPTLKIWTDVCGSYIKWKGKDARLIVCHDISRFKK